MGIGESCPDLVINTGREWSAVIGCLRQPAMDCKWCLVKTREWRSINLHGGMALLRGPKSPRNRRHVKQINEQLQKCDMCGYNAHKPQEKCSARNESCKKSRKIWHFAQVCRSRKSNVNLLDQMDYAKDSGEEKESPNGNMHLLHVVSLKMNGIKDRQNSCESSELWEVLLVPMQV